MTCTNSCQKPTRSQAHCGAANCHRTFSGVSGFDRHRRGGECLDPATFGFVEVNRIWRWPGAMPSIVRLAAERKAEMPVAAEGADRRAP